MIRISLLKNSLFILLFFSLTPQIFLNANTAFAFNKDSISFKLISAQRIFPVLSSNATEHRISAGKILGGKELIGSMGGVFPVINLSHKEKIFQFSIASTLYTHLNKPPVGLQVINADFFVDLYFDLQLNRSMLFRIGPGHTSQHLTDDSFEILGYTQSRNYVRDYWQFFALYKFNKLRSFAYGGIFYHYNFIISDRPTPQIAGTCIWQTGIQSDIYRFNDMIKIYAGGDVKFRGELDFNNSFNIQSGIAIHNKSDRTLRLAYNYRGGYEERGQFYDQKNTFHSISLYLDF
jgi:hypothetical protein